MVFIAMEDDASVKKLAELIFSKQFTNTEEAMAPDISIPANLLPNDFSQRIRNVLYMKQLILNSTIQNLIMKCFYITSCQMYLIFIMFACLSVHECQKNVFESFICVCVLLKLVGEGMFNLTGMDLRELNTDAFMVFYDHVLKNDFCEDGGFRRFAEYINGHRYLKWNWEDLVSTDQSTSVIIPRDVEIEIQKESRKLVLQTSEADIETIKVRSMFLAMKLLPMTSSDVSYSQNSLDVIKYQEASRNEEVVRKTERERIPQTTGRCADLDETYRECSSSNSEPIAKRVVNQNGDNACYEDTIRAVIRCNNSRNSDYGNSDNRIEQEADIIMDHLNTKISQTTGRCVDLDETYRGCSNSNFESITNQAVNQNGDNAWCEDTIRAVIRHNHSRNSDYGNSDNRIKQEADKILEHLKTTIKSFIAVLDEYDEV